MSTEHGSSSDKMGVKNEYDEYCRKTRIENDAELIKGGAQREEGDRLEVTEEQLTKSKLEMRGDIPVQDIVRKMVDMKIALDAFESLGASDDRSKVEMAKAKRAYLDIEYLLNGLSHEQKVAVERELYKDTLISEEGFNDKMRGLKSRLEWLKNKE